MADHHLNGTVDSGDGYHSCDGYGNTPETLAAIRLTTTCHVIFPPFSLAGTAWQRRKQPETNWRVFWQPHNYSSFFVFDLTPGKATGSVSDGTRVRSLARRKSKWTMGGCGALRRCGCAWTYEGTQFLCVKFRLGSAGEPTICSHCYDVLNEDTGFTAVFSKPSDLTHLLLKPEYLGPTKSIPWWLMPWLLASPGHQQPWHWLCRTNESYLLQGPGFQLSVSSKCWETMKIHAYFYVSCCKFSTTRV